MQNLIKSNRSYTDVNSNVKYDVYTDEFTHQLYFIDKEGNELKKPYYACAFDSVTIKLNTGKTIDMSFNDMYVCKKGEKVVSRRFAGFNKFSKL
jgi:hypothetical protein